MRDDRQRVLDIQEAIERIERYASRGKVTFEKDELIQNWILRHIQLIGEAASNVSRDFRAKHPEIIWDDIIGMRNVLVHQYFEIDISLV